MADDLGDVDIDDAGNPDDDDEGWETEDEMEAQAEVDDSELTFSKHSGKCNFSSVVGPSHLIESRKTMFACPGSVFCVSLDPATNCMVVTGGEDDKAYVWRLTDGEVLLECTGRKCRKKRKCTSMLLIDIITLLAHFGQELAVLL